MSDELQARSVTKSKYFQDMQDRQFNELRRLLTGDERSNEERYYHSLDVCAQIHKKLVRCLMSLRAS